MDYSKMSWDELFDKAEKKIQEYQALLFKATQKKTQIEKKIEECKKNRDIVEEKKWQEQLDKVEDEITYYDNKLY